MPRNYIREGFQAITVSVSVPDAEGLLTFLKHVFDAVVVSRSERPDGTSCKRRGADRRFGARTLRGERAVRDDDRSAPRLRADTDATYGKAIGAGAQSVYEPAEMPYGERGAGVQDRWGNRWGLATMSTR